MEGKKFEIHQRKKFRLNSVESIGQTLSEVDPIEIGSLTINTEEDLDKAVELPLREACKIFFRKGIGTWMSSANQKDVVSGEVYIIVNFDTLSDQNKLIAREFGTAYSYLGREYLKIVMPITSSTTVEEISEHMSSIANRFDDQV